MSLPCASARPEEFKTRKEWLDQQLAYELRGLEGEMMSTSRDDRTVRTALYMIQRFLSHRFPSLRFHEPRPDVEVIPDLDRHLISAGILNFFFRPCTRAGKAWCDDLKELAHDVQSAW